MPYAARPQAAAIDKAAVTMNTRLMLDAVLPHRPRGRERGQHDGQPDEEQMKRPERPCQCPAPCTAAAGAASGVPMPSRMNSSGTNISTMKNATVNSNAP